MSEPAGEPMDRKRALRGKHDKKKKLSMDGLRVRSGRGDEAVKYSGTPKPKMKVADQGNEATLLSGEAVALDGDVVALRVLGASEAPAGNREKTPDRFMFDSTIRAALVDKIGKDKYKSGRRVSDLERKISQFIDEQEAQGIQADVNQKYLPMVLSSQ